MNCHSCQEDVTTLTDVRTSAGIQGFCDWCVNTYAETCSVCQELTDRYAAYEITKGTKSVFVCPDCPMKWAAKELLDTLGLSNLPVLSLRTNAIRL